jgi:hypothetical protein
MKYAVEIVEMDSDAMIYIPSIQTHSQHGDLISLLSFFFFKMRKVG